MHPHKMLLIVITSCGLMSHVWRCHVSCAQCILTCQSRLYDNIMWATCSMRVRCHGNQMIHAFLHKPSDYDTSCELHAPCVTNAVWAVLRASWHNQTDYVNIIDLHDPSVSDGRQQVSVPLDIMVQIVIASCELHAPFVSMPCEQYSVHLDVIM